MFADLSADYFEMRVVRRRRPFSVLLDIHLEIIDVSSRLVALV